MAISVGSITYDTSLMLRSIIGSAITATGSCFTSFPERATVYPLVTVEVTRGADAGIGGFYEGRYMPLRAEVVTYAKKTKDRDTIADVVYQQLRKMQLNTGSGTTGSALFDFKLVDERHENETGREGIHKCIQVFEYKFVAVP